ncbi:tetratricopeptide repeat protein [Pseudoalteromonas sp. T1lg65]|uniref:tetratricopeptide repeat protein n=1 Tax=Pseudoalteromonas sp. T1lg65 TaxID=2077101 RepID=UPI003F78C849
MKLQLIVPLVTLVLLTGCQSSKSVQIDHTIVNSTNKFTPHAVETRSDVFNLNADIRSKLDFYFGQNNGLKMADSLMDFLINSGDASLAYQSGANLTASQAFYNLNANCLSLSILSYSIAKHLGLRTQFQRVDIPEFWDRSRGYSLLTGHVNIKVSEYDTSLDNVNTLYTNPRSATIDFDPNSRDQGFDTHAITSDRILSMFYNNKGAMAMIAEQFDTAYSYYKAAIQADPYHDGTWGNLGVLYRLTNQYELAERAYEQALALNSANRNVLGNLAKLYRLTDRVQIAENIESRIHHARQQNPYYQIVLGNEALQKNDYDKALRHFRDARALNNKIHGAYFGMAMVYYAQGDMSRTEDYLQRAFNTADFTHDQKRYAGKLAMLKSVAKYQPREAN